MKRGVAVAVVAGALSLLGCPGDPRDKAKPTVVARVGDEDIVSTELMSALAQHGIARVADKTARNVVARAILDELVTDRLMLAAAERAGITVRDDEVDREVRSRAEGYPAGAFQRLLIAEQLTLTDFRKKVKDRLVEDAFLRAKLAQAPPITEAELHARFDVELEGHRVTEQVRARQILVRTTEEATHILDQLKTKKLAFEAAAQRYSTAPDAELGGDLGWFSKGDMPDVFNVCFNLEKGTLSDVIASDYGFHIFQILDRREEHPMTFEAARERLEEEVMRERQDDAYQRLLAELKNETPVKIFDSAVAHVVTLLPPAPLTPIEPAPEHNNARALDSLPTAIDPVPPVPGREKRPAKE